MPIDWHQIEYASNSTGAATFVQLDDLQHALDSMWGEEGKAESTSWTRPE